MNIKKVVDSHIVDIIQKEPVREQGDLQEILKSRGYDIPQATLSRKLKKLNIVKIDGIYKIIEFTAPSLPIVLDMKISDFGLIVLHTHPGNANSLAYFIDQKYVDYNDNDSTIMGTIAGDDTVLVIAKDRETVEKIKEIFTEIFPYIKK